jgi:hypothetical protein
MRLTDQFTIGNITTIVIVLGALVRFETRIASLVRTFLMEHEILIRDYCKRNDIKPDELPSRMHGVLGKN